MKLRKEIKGVLLLIGVIIVLVGCVKLLNAIEKNEYNKAITRCGNKNNIVEHISEYGDNFYTCKVER